MPDSSSVIAPAASAGRSASAGRDRRLAGELFSLGGLLAPYATTRLELAPWAFSAALLMVLAFWDPMARGAEPDAVLMGLSFYELLIGLTTDRRARR